MIPSVRCSESIAAAPHREQLTQPSTQVLGQQLVSTTYYIRQHHHNITSK